MSYLIKYIQWGPATRTTDTEVDSLILTFEIRINISMDSESVRIVNHVGEPPYCYKYGQN